MKKRLMNIELLRIVSMLMIIELHLLVFTKTLDTYNTFSKKSVFIWLVESLCYVAVNCYVLISGYFLVDSKFKFKKIITIWIEVLFYSLIIYFTLLITHKISFTAESFKKSICPFLFRNYWFVTVYITLYIVSPFLNKLINSLNKTQYTYLILIIFIFFSIWNTFIPHSDTINYVKNYNISWFICLYFIAGYLKKFYSDKKIKKSICIFIYLISSAINILAYFVIKKFEIKFIRPDFLYYYFSITVLTASISLFMFFKNLTINNKVVKKIIGFFAPTTFGIYLIHENPNLRNIIWQKFNFIKYCSPIQMVALIIIMPICLFITLSLIDKLRLVIFSIFNKVKYNKTPHEFRCVKNLEDTLCQK